MAKSLYSALFDWIVLRINHALLNKKDMEESVPVRHKSHSTYTQTYINVSYPRVRNWKHFYFSVLVHRRPGHFWLRRLCHQQLRAVLHQLCKRAAAVLLQPSHLQPGTGERLLFIVYFLRFLLTCLWNATKLRWHHCRHRSVRDDSSDYFLVCRKRQVTLAGSVGLNWTGSIIFILVTKLLKS